MPRDHRLYLDDIIEAIARIRRHTAGMDLAAFAGDDKTVDAVVRNLEIIGEAARGLPVEVTAQRPEVDWRSIVALRNVLAHEYFGVNLAIVWDVVSNYLTPLEEACRQLLAGNWPAGE